MRYLLIALILLGGCRSRDKKVATASKPTTEVIDSEVQRLDEVIESIDLGTTAISNDIKNIDLQADKIAKPELKTAIKLSALSIKKSNESIKLSSKKIKEKVKPGLINAKKSAKKTEQALEDAEENKALVALINRLIFICLIGLGVSIGITAKIPNKFSEAACYGFGGTLIGCGCYQWFMKNPWVSGTITITFIVCGVAWILFKHTREIKEAIDLINDDDKQKLVHNKNYLKNENKIVK